MEALLERYGALIMIGFRFLYAMRSVTPFVLGSLGVSAWRFLFYDVIGTLIWSTTVSLVAWHLAHAVDKAIAHIHNIEQLALVGVVIAVAIGGLVYYLRRR